MSDIFISYKREEQDTARRLANALEQEGWTVWWDPKIRAGDHFDDVIEAALGDSKCAIVLWSKLSVTSRYVKDEATYALNHNKLVPVAIEVAELPFRFTGIQTAQLIDWDGSIESRAYKNLLIDIIAILGPPPAMLQAEAEAKRLAREEERKKVEAEKQDEEEQRRKDEEEARSRTEEAQRQAAVETTRLAQKEPKQRIVQAHSPVNKGKIIIVIFAFLAAFVFLYHWLFIPPTQNKTQSDSSLRVVEHA